jgi:hypothetical protein
MGSERGAVSKQEKRRTKLATSSLFHLGHLALIQIVIFAKTLFISVHPLQPTIDELMNARNRYEQ